MLPHSKHGVLTRRCLKIFQFFQILCFAAIRPPTDRIACPIFLCSGPQTHISCGWCRGYNHTTKWMHGVARTSSVWVRFRYPRMASWIFFALLWSHFPPIEWRHSRARNVLATVWFTQHTPALRVAYIA